MDKQASQSRQAGDKRMAQAVRGIVIGWIGKQQVAGHGRLKKAIEGDQTPIDRGGSYRFETLLGVQTHYEWKAAFVEFLAPGLAWFREIHHLHLHNQEYRLREHI